MFPHDDTFFQIIPLELDLKSGAEPTVKQIRFLHDTYGFTMFLLTAPSKSSRATGFPSMEEYEQFAHIYRDVTAQIPSEIVCGWWWITTIKTGHSEEHPGLVRADGSEVYYSPDPIYPAYRKAVAERIARFAEIAHPAFIFNEDDYSIMASTGGGCFCEAHLDAFAKRVGHRYTREELVKALAEDAKNGYALTREWQALSRDTLVELSKAIRTELDKKTPEIPMGLMQTGHVEREGDMTDAVSRALAGEKHRPFCRFYGVDYGGMRLDEIPDHLFHEMKDRERLGNDFIFIQECDPFPQSRFFTSSKQVLTMQYLAYSYGLDGSTYNMVPLYPDTEPEPTYGKTIAAERARLQALCRTVKNCHLEGVYLPYDNFDNASRALFQKEEPLWQPFLSAAGIPYTTKEREGLVWMVDARTVLRASDEELGRMLAGRMMMDGDAAKVLCERGYAEDLGVRVNGIPTEEEPFRFDLGATERLCDGVLPECRDRILPAAHMWAPRGNGKQYCLEPLDDSCEILCNLFDGNGGLRCASMTRYVNRRGGRIVVMGETLNGNASQSLFHYGRAALIKEQIAWCGGSVITTDHTAKVSLTVNRPKGEDQTAYLTLVNLGEDEDETVTLNLPQGKTVSAVNRLNEAGEWTSVGFTVTESKATLLLSLKTARPEFVKLTF